MKFLLKTSILLFLSLLLGLFKIYAQENESKPVLFKIETNDGNEFIGEIILEDELFIELLTSNLGKLSIKKIDIKKQSLLIATSVKDGDIWFRNFQATRHFWSPNGYGLKKGEAYYQNVWVLFNQASVGVNDYFSMGFGMIPLFLFATSTPVWFLPKISIPLVKDKVNVGGGALMGTIVGEDAASFGIVYGNLTLGSMDKNITFGLGKGYTEGEFGSGATFNIGTVIRTNQRNYFITETYFFSADSEVVGFTALGGRRLLKNVGFDYGLVIPFGLGIDQFIGIPWLGITMPLGKKNK